MLRYKDELTIQIKLAWTTIYEPEEYGSEFLALSSVVPRSALMARHVFMPYLVYAGPIFASQSAPY